MVGERCGGTDDAAGVDEQRSGIDKSVGADRHSPPLVVYRIAAPGVVQARLSWNGVS